MRLLFYILFLFLTPLLVKCQDCDFISNISSSLFSLSEIRVTALNDSYVNLTYFPSDAIEKIYNQSLMNLKKGSSFIYEFYFRRNGTIIITLSCNTLTSKVFQVNLTGINFNSTFDEKKPGDIGDSFNYTIRFNGSRPKNVNYTCSLDLIKDHDKIINENLIGRRYTERLEGNTCTFYNMRVSRSGNYKLKIIIEIKDLEIEFQQTQESEYFFIENQIEDFQVSKKYLIINQENLIVLKPFGRNFVAYLEKFNVKFEKSEKIRSENYENIDAIENFTFNIYPHDEKNIQKTFIVSNDNKKGNELKKIITFIVIYAKLKVSSKSTIFDSNSRSPFYLMIELTNMLDVLIQTPIPQYIPQITVELIPITPNSQKVIQIDSNNYPNGQYQFLLEKNPFMFEKLYLLSSGSFMFKVSAGEQIQEGFSSNITSKTFIKSLSYNFTTLNISNYFKFSIIFYVLGDDDAPYSSEDFLLNIVEKSDLGLVGNTNFSSSDGIFKVNDLMFLGSGLAKLEIITTNITQVINFTVSQSILFIENIGQIPTSSDFFKLNASIYDITKTNKSKNLHTISLELMPDTNISGNNITGILTKTGSETIPFDNLRILSSGKFKLKVSGINLTSFIAPKPFQIVNKILFSTIRTESDIEPSVFEDFNLTLNLFGEDQNKYLPNSDIRINQIDDIIQKNPLLKNEYSKPLIFTLFPKNSGDYTFNISLTNTSSNYTSSHLAIHVSPAYISPKELPKNIFQDTEFNLSFIITKDKIKNIRMTQANNFSVNIDLKCVEDSSFSCEKFNFTGIRKVSCMNGFLNFYNLTINQPSKFLVFLSSEKNETYSFILESILEVKPISSFIIENSIPDTNSRRKNSLTISSFAYGRKVPNVTFELKFGKNPNKNFLASGTMLNQNMSKSYVTDFQGVCRIDNLFILSSGYFIFEVIKNNQTFVTYETDFNENFIKQINVKFPGFVYVNYPFDIFYDLIGDDDNPFILGTNISLNESHLYPMTGMTLHSSDSPSGFFTISLNLNKFHDFFIKTDANPSLLTNFSINSLNNTLSVRASFENLTTVNDSSLLTMNGFVFGEDPEKIEKFNGSYKAFLTEVNKKLEIIKIETFQGVFNFSFSIKTAGVYNLTIIPGPSLLCTFSKTLKVVSTIKDMKYNSSFLPSSELTLIKFPVFLISYDDSLYLSKEIIHLSCSDNSGLLNSSIITSTGQAIFFLFFQSKGSYDCTFQAEDNNKSLKLKFEIFQDRLNTDKECFIQNYDLSCYKCASNSKMNQDGNCECSKNSEFDSTLKSCICLKGFKSVNNFCSTCGFYFESKDITAYFSEDFRKIFVDFASSANMGLIDEERNWRNAFTLPGELMSYYSNAEWISSKRFEIYFKRPVNGNNSTLIMNPNLIQKEPDGDCDDKIEELSIPLIVKDNKPVPEFSLVAPRKVSLLCGQNLIIISASVRNSRYLYSWSSSEPLLSIQLFNKTSSSLEIDLKNISTDKVDVNLTVTDSFFNTSRTKSEIIEISNKKVILVIFPQGQIIPIKTFEKLSIKAQVLDLCGKSNLNYNWTLVQTKGDDEVVKQLGPSIDSNTSSMITIDGASLLFDYSSHVSLTVNSSDVIGLASAKLMIFSSPLVLSLNRVSGNISTLYNLTLEATVKDPDQIEYSNFTYEWKCFDGENKNCLNNEKNQLESGSFIEILNSHLQNNSLWTFSVVVRRTQPFKEAEAEVQLYFSDRIRGEIIMMNLPKVINEHNSLVLAPKLFLDGEKDVKWIIDPLPENELLYNNEYLHIPAGTLKPGKNYIFKIHMKKSGELDDTSVTSSVGIYVNSPPSCEKFLVKVEKFGKLLLSAEDCIDKDSDSSIQYQFGYRNNGSDIWLTKLMSFPSIKLRIPKDAEILSLKVCDSELSCSISTSKKPKTKTARFLSISKELFNKDIEDIDETPASIIYFSNQIKSTEDQKLLFHKLKEYFSSTDIDISAIDSISSCLNSIISESPNDPSIDKTFTSNITNFIKNTLKKYKQSLSQENFKKLVKVFNRLMNVFEPLKIAENLKYFSDFAMKNEVVNTSVVDETTGFARFRTSKDFLISENWTSVGLNVRFPQNLTLDEGKNIYDFITHSYFKDFPVFDVTLRKVGDFNNGLKIYEEDEEVAVISSEGVEIELKGDFDLSKKLECKYLSKNNTWTTSECRIIKTIKSQVTLLVPHFSIYSVQIVASDFTFICTEGFGPLLIMASLVSIMIIALYCLKNKTKNSCSLKNSKSFIRLHPVIRIFSQETFGQGSLAVIHMVTSQMILVALIGIFHYFFFKGQKQESLSDFKLESLKLGAAAWILSQSIAFPIFRFHVLSVKRKLFQRVALIVCAGAMVFCIFSVVFVTVKFCEGLSYFLVFNWGIFTVADFFSFQIVYAFVLNRLSERKAKKYENTQKQKNYDCEGNNEEKKVSESEEKRVDFNFNELIG